MDVRRLRGGISYLTEGEAVTASETAPPYWVYRMSSDEFHAFVTALRTSLPTEEVPYRKDAGSHAFDRCCIACTRRWTWHWAWYGAHWIRFWRLFA